MKREDRLLSFSLTDGRCVGKRRLQDVLDVLEMTFLVVFCGEMAVLLMALGQVVCLLSRFFFDDENVKKSKKKQP